MNKNLSPTRLNITDLPRDPDGCLGGLRKALVASTNYCKKYSRKLPVLKATLIYVLKHIIKFEEVQAAKAKLAKEAADKAQKESKALAKADAKASAEVQAKALAEKEAADLEVARKLVAKADGA